MLNTDSPNSVNGSECLATILVKKEKYQKIQAQLRERKSAIERRAASFSAFATDVLEKMDFGKWDRLTIDADLDRLFSDLSEFQGLISQSAALRAELEPHADLFKPLG